MAEQSSEQAVPVHLVLVHHGSVRRLGEDASFHAQATAPEAPRQANTGAGASAWEVAIVDALQVKNLRSVQALRP
jgi:hypothetical protein